MSVFSIGAIGFLFIVLACTPSVRLIG